MKRHPTITALLVGGLATLYLGSYVVMRASGRLNIDPGFHPPKLGTRNADGSTYSEAPGLYALAARFEALVTNGKFRFGSARTDVRYRGQYTESKAKSLAKWIAGDLPLSAKNYGGDYDCAYYDDDIRQTIITFQLSEIEWDVWSRSLPEAMSRFGNVDELRHQDSVLEADYGNSAGVVGIAFSDGKVEISRRVKD